MSHAIRRPSPAAQDPTLRRACIGILGLFPMITATLMQVVESLPVAAVIAGMGAVTIMALLPRPSRRRA